MVQRGPDRPKRVQNGLTDLVPFGPLRNVDKPAMFSYFWSKMDQRDPDGPKKDPFTPKVTNLASVIGVLLD